MTYKAKTTGLSFGSILVGLVHHPTGVLVDASGVPITDANPMPVEVIGPDPLPISNPALNIDGVTNCLKTTDGPHHEIHEGASFTCHYSTTTAAADDHRTAIGFSTPDTGKHGHLTATVSSDQPAEVFLLRAPTIDANAGTDLSIFNRNENVLTPSVMLSLENPAVAGGATSYDEGELAAANLVGGTEIDYTVLAGGKGPRVVGGSARGSQEWVLRQNTIYMFILQNLGANATTHTINLDWYEHTSIQE